MACNVTITAKNGSNIKLKQVATIIDVNTFEENLKRNSGEKIATITIKGGILHDDIQSSIDLFKWSHDFSEDGVYRTVKIEECTESSSITQTFEFKEVFVIRYIENLDEKYDKSAFVLTLRQKEGNLTNNSKNY